MKKIILLLSLFLLFGCGRNLLPTGTIQQQSFSETIPFNFDKGLPIIKVTIKGVDYNFMVDTGAPTVVSPEIAAILKPEKVKKSTVGDSQGNNGKQEFIVVDEIKIGNLAFNDIGAVVIDMKQSFEVKCIGLDGLIGSNQMSNAIWEFDYTNKNITITDDFENFKEPKGASKLSFIDNSPQKTPLVKVQIDSIQSSYLTFDTGANGGINLRLSQFKETIKEYPQAKSYGSSSSGIYGVGKSDTITIAKIPFMKVGNLKLKNQLVNFDEMASFVMGNSFLRNYKTTINWKTKNIYLLPQETEAQKSFETLGLSIRYINNKPTVALLHQNSDAEKVGLQLGDIILDIDGNDLTQLSEEQACNYVFNNILNKKKEASITFIRNNEKQTVKIATKVLLE